MELVNALFRYLATPHTENDLPFRQTIPQSLDSINVLMRDSLGVFQIGTLIKISGWEADKIERSGSTTRSEVVLNNKLKVIVQSGYGGVSTFWKFIINDQEIQKIDSYFKCNQKELNAHTCRPIEDLLYDFLSLSWEKISPFVYTEYWDRFQYYLENNNLIICTVEQSAKRWLEYFSNKKIMKED